MRTWSLGYSVGPSGSCPTSHASSSFTPTPCCALAVRHVATPGWAEYQAERVATPSGGSRSHLFSSTHNGGPPSAPVSSRPARPVAGSFAAAAASTTTHSTSAWVSVVRTLRIMAPSSALRDSASTPGVSTSIPW